jgi:diphthamide synthase subunit DPH2
VKIRKKKSCQKVQKVFKKLSRKLSKLSKKCQKIVKSSLKKAKIANFEVEDETCGRRKIRRRR